MISYDSVKADKLRDFVAYLESPEAESSGFLMGDKSGEGRKELARRIRMQISWLEEKIFQDELKRSDLRQSANGKLGFL